MARRLDRLQTLAETLRQQYRIDVVVERVDLTDLAAVIQLHQRLREGGIAIDTLAFQGVENFRSMRGIEERALPSVARRC